jgi:hypothetical protein
VRFPPDGDFLRFIETKRNANTIRVVKAIILDIRERLGANDELKILKSNFVQMDTAAKDLIQLLTDLDESANKPLIDQLVALRRYLAVTGIPEADQGDRPSETQARIVRHVFETVKAMYPDLHRFGEPSPCFEKVSEIIGTNEFLHDFGQIDRPEIPGSR